MERPIREDFEGENSDHITDWLYDTNKYSEALEKYIDSLEKQLKLCGVSKSFSFTCTNGYDGREKYCECKNECLKCMK